MRGSGACYRVQSTGTRVRLCVVQGVIDLCLRRRQWYDLLCRTALAAYHHVYRFVLSNLNDVRKCHTQLSTSC